MPRSLGKLNRIAIGIAMFTLTRTAVTGEATADGTESGSEPPMATHPERPAQVASANIHAGRHWQLGIALNAVSYQHAAFTLTPKSSPQSFPSTLDRTNLGPSGSSILIEPGYVIGNQCVVGLMLDIGSAMNELEVKGLRFHVTQTAASFVIGPRVAYYFFPQSAFQPFLTLALGYTTTPSQQAAQTLKITEYQGFFGAGMAYLPIPSFSFDTSVRVAYGIGSGYVDSPPLEDANLSGSVLTLMWTIGTTGWLN